MKIKTILLITLISVFICSCNSSVDKDTSLKSETYLKTQLKANGISDSELKVVDQNKLNSLSREEVDNLVSDIVKMRSKNQIKFDAYSSISNISESLLAHLNGAHSELANSCFKELAEIEELKGNHDVYFKRYYTIVKKYKKLFPDSDIDSLKNALIKNNITID